MKGTTLKYERELDFIIQKIKEIHAAKKKVQNPDGTFRKLSGETLLFCAGPWLVGVLVL